MKIKKRKRNLDKCGGELKNKNKFKEWRILNNLK